MVLMSRSSAARAGASEIRSAQRLSMGETALPTQTAAEPSGSVRTAQVTGLTVKTVCPRRPKLNSIPPASQAPREETFWNFSDGGTMKASCPASLSWRLKSLPPRSGRIVALR